MKKIFFIIGKQASKAAKTDMRAWSAELQLGMEPHPHAVCDFSLRTDFSLQNAENSIKTLIGKDKPENVIVLFAGIDAQEFAEKFVKKGRLISMEHLLQVVELLGQSLSAKWKAAEKKEFLKNFAFNGLVTYCKPDAYASKGRISKPKRIVIRSS